MTRRGMVPTLPSLTTFGERRFNTPNHLEIAGQENRLSGHSVAIRHQIHRMTFSDGSELARDVVLPMP